MGAVGSGARSAARERCPKRMTYGPCGGVGFAGECEVSPQRCSFVDLETVRWHGVEADAPPGRSDPVPAPRPPARADWMRGRLAAGRVVVADLPARALDADSLAECAGILVGSVDAVLAGDSGSARVQFAPSYRAQLLRAAGMDVWSGLNCRDRNRVALEGELAALAHAGVAGVHCVTGDHTRTGARPDAAPVFDLDSTGLASIARAAGHLVSVAEAPATPPVARRAARLVEKARAGAEVCFVNHAGGAGPVADFVAAARAQAARVEAPRAEAPPVEALRAEALSVEAPPVEAGGAVPTAEAGRAGLAFVPCVPVIVDPGSAALLRSFTTLVLPPGYLDGILADADPAAAGIAAAVDLSEELLAVEGVSGVNLSGGAAPGREAWFAEALATIGQRLR
ncbi:MAG: methylenetetrahydrofolate reductase C-terminal domain-containing protein [Microbacteriaceae bacterium]